VDQEPGPGQELEQLLEENARLKADERKAIKRYRREEQLKPFQAELLGVQQYLEEKRRRMIILFEGRMRQARAARYAG